MSSCELLQGERLLVSGEYPFLQEELTDLGAQVFATSSDDRLPRPVRFHPDMQLCRLKESLFVLRDSVTQADLERRGIPFQTTERTPTDRYPGDVLCNAFVLSDRLVCDPSSVDPAILREAEREGLRVLPVHQGYAACSTAVVDEKSVITADRGVAKALEEAGFTVLLIQPGEIDLPEYDTGFIGGCCGKVSEKLILFTGKIDSHSDGTTIRRFIKERNIAIKELDRERLLDVGGIKRLF